MDLKRVLEIMDKRKWLIIFSMALTLGLVWLVTRVLPAKWQSTVKFAITSTSPILNTQSQSQDSENLERGARTEVFGALVKDEDVVTEAARVAGISIPLPKLVEKIEFESKGSRLFEMRFSDTDPIRSKKFANALAENFVKKNQSISTDQARRNSELIAGQLKQSENKLDTLRAQYENSIEANKINGADPNSEIVIAQRRLESAKYAKDQADSSVVQNQSLLQTQTNTGTPETITQFRPGTTDALQDKIQEEIYKIDDELRQKRANYTDENPDVKSLLERKKFLVIRLEKARTDQVKSTVPNPLMVEKPRSMDELKKLIAKDQALARSEDANIAEAERELARLRSTSSPMSVLKGKIDAEAEHRTGLAARLNNAQSAWDVVKRNTSLEIVARVGDSNPPMNTTSGRNQKILILAVLAAFLLSTSLAVIFDSMDKRLKSMEEADQVLPARVLAVIPPPQGEALLQDWARAAELHPQSPQAEAYRFLGQHLLNPQNRYYRSMMVLAAKSGQGNTRTVTNLAITLAQSGHSVILIDANVRHPALHKVFGMNNVFGLTNILQNPEPAVIEKSLNKTAVENLRVILSGPEYRNPWELFGSARLNKMAEILNAKADYVLYDTSNASLYSDTLSLATIVDGALLCVRAVEPLTGAEQRLKDVLEQSEIPILGTILVDAPPSLLGSYQNYTPSASQYVHDSPVASIESSSPSGRHKISDSLFEDPADLPVPVAENSFTTESFAATPQDETLPAFEAPSDETPISNHVEAAASEKVPDYVPMPTVRQRVIEPIFNPAPDQPTKPAQPSKKELEMANGFETPPGGFPRAISGYAVGPVDDYVRKMNTRLETLLQQMDQENNRQDDSQRIVEETSTELELARKQLQEYEVRESERSHSLTGFEAERNEMERELNEERARTKSGYDKMLTEARQEADKMLSEERQDTEILITNAQRNAASLVAEARRHTEESNSRAESFQLEAERLRAEIAEVRSSAGEAPVADRSSKVGDEMAAQRAYMVSEMEKMLTDARSRTEENTLKSSEFYKVQEARIESLSRECESLVGRIRNLADPQTAVAPVAAPASGSDERRTHEGRDWRNGEWRVGNDWRNAS